MPGDPTSQRKKLLHTESDQSVKSLQALFAELGLLVKKEDDALESFNVLQLKTDCLKDRAAIRALSYSN